MLIESAANTKLLRTLTYGLFPLNVLEFQESEDFFEQITFVDYQLQLIILNESQGEGEELLPHPSSLFAHTEKLRLLIDYAVSVAANYNDLTKSYQESLYYCCVLAHLYYLVNEPEALLAVLGKVHVNPVETEDELVRYLHCRYKVLQGFGKVPLAQTMNAENSNDDFSVFGEHGIEGSAANPSNGTKAASAGAFGAKKSEVNDAVWVDYLVHWKANFTKSHVAANRWHDLLLSKLTGVLSADGSVKLEFSQIKQLPIAVNQFSMITLCNYLCRFQNAVKVDVNFKSDYSLWLMRTLEERMNLRDVKFPNASETSFSPTVSASSELNVFVDNLYDSLDNVLYYYNILSPAASKKFLVYCTTMTYQSQTVLGNLIKTLIDLNEYDEAFAAMKTYVRYLEMEQAQHSGEVLEDVLKIVDVYSTCILAFNPTKSIISKKKFKYTNNHLVVALIESLIEGLLKYLGVLANICALRYDSDIQNHDEEHEELLFLYKKYNLSLLLSDKSLFIGIVSTSWYALGKFYQFMATYEAPTEAKLIEYKEKSLKFFKNGLTINPTGSLELLFNYALELSLNFKLNQSAKLCKFILKKYPESFMTWNLLVLILTLFELYNQDKITGTIISGTSSAENNHIDGGQILELEKMITSALNIAALFIEKYNESEGGVKNLSFETRYHIIQLKITQLAVLEYIYGVQYILELLPDLFGLFHELFEYEYSHIIPTTKIVKAQPDNTWSHRPSFIDPKVAHAATAAASRAKVSKEIDRNGNSDMEHITEKLKGLGRTKLHIRNASRATNGTTKTNGPLPSTVQEDKLLQELWLWTSNLYAKVGNLDQAEECIVEAETVHELNVRTYASLGSLTSKSRKFLSLQEFEKALESIFREGRYFDKRDFGFALLGLCKLFMVDDKADSSLFISATDMDAGIIRLKNYLEKFILCSYGYNQPEIWWYLSLIYEKIDDKVLLNKSLWKCIELEDLRPVRDFGSTVFNA